MRRMDPLANRGLRVGPPLRSRVWGCAVILLVLVACRGGGSGTQGPARPLANSSATSVTPGARTLPPELGKVEEGRLTPGDSYETKRFPVNLRMTVPDQIYGADTPG